MFNPILQEHDNVLTSAIAYRNGDVGVISPADGSSQLLWRLPGRRSACPPVVSSDGRRVFACDFNRIRCMARDGAMLTELDITTLPSVQDPLAHVAWYLRYWDAVDCLDALVMQPAGAPKLVRVALASNTTRVVNLQSGRGVQTTLAGQVIEIEIPSRRLVLRTLDGKISGVWTLPDIYQETALSPTQDLLLVWSLETPAKPVLLIDLSQTGYNVLPVRATAAAWLNNDTLLLCPDSGTLQSFELATGRLEDLISLHAGAAPGALVPAQPVVHANSRHVVWNRHSRVADTERHDTIVADLGSNRYMTTGVLGHFYAWFP